MAEHKAALVRAMGHLAKARYREHLMLTEFGGHFLRMQVHTEYTYGVALCDLLKGRLTRDEYHMVTGSVAP